MNTDNYTSYNTSNEDTNFREMLDVYLRYWKWFLLAAIVAIICAVLYLRFTAPSYIAFSTVIIEDEESKGPTANANTFTDLGLFSGLKTSSIENELGLLRSKRLMTNAVKALDLNIKYFAVDGIPRKEIYKDSPYLIRLMRLNENRLSRAISDGKNQFNVTGLKDGKVKISFPNSSKKSIVESLGDVIELDFADIVLNANEKVIDSDKDYEHTVDIEFVPIKSEVFSFQSKLGVELVDENSTFIRLSMVDNVKLKAQDVLDQLVFQYNQEAIEDKNLIARNTAFFIDERLDIINSELDSVESGKEQFKEANRLTDIQAESSMIIQNVSEYNNQQQAVNNQLELTNAMIDHLQASDAKLMPTNIGIDEPGTTMLIDEYNSLVLERERLLKGAGDENPAVVTLNEQLQQIRNNINTSLDRRQSNLVISRDNLRRQAGILGSQISEVPGQERQYRGIERQQNIKEALYLFLLRKREENSLSLAAKTPKAKLVDQAFSINAPIAPNSKIVMAVALLIGLFIPFLLINIRNLLNNKVENRQDVDKIADTIPVIAEIPRIGSNKKDVIKPNERSVLSEAFNIISANLQFVKKKQKSKEEGTCILFTSSVMGEGKTFAAINLGITYAMAGKKVLVIGADLRNPQLTRYIKDRKPKKGLSDYLATNDYTIDDLLLGTGLHENFKILHSGTTPPNPAGLLRSDKMDGLFEELKTKFDYIIVDSAPAMLVADTFLISHYADLTLYVVRANYTKKKALNFVVDAVNKGKLTQTGIILNDIPMKNASYGYTYGYVYGAAT